MVVRAKIELLSFEYCLMHFTEPSNCNMYISKTLMEKTKCVTNSVNSKVFVCGTVSRYENRHLCLNLKVAVFAKWLTFRDLLYGC